MHREATLSRAAPIWNRVLGRGKRRQVSIFIADIEQHSFALNACHFSRFKIDHEEGLFALKNAQIWPFLLHTAQDRALVITKIHEERNEFAGACHRHRRHDGADPYVDLIEHGFGDAGFDGRRLHAVQATALPRSVRLESCRSAMRWTAASGDDLRSKAKYENVRPCELIGAAFASGWLRFQFADRTRLRNGSSRGR